MFDPDWGKHQASEGTRLLTEVHGNFVDWYINDRLIEDSSLKYYLDQMRMCISSCLHCKLDDGTSLVVMSYDKQLPTTATPRAYRKHVNLKLLEDIDNEC